MSLSDVRRKVAEVMGSDDMRKCRSCGQSAKHETLADHGGMCFPCFAAYCRQPTRGIEGAAPNELPNFRAWAYRLKAREEAGERLTLPQREMWRDALQHAHAVLDAARVGAPVPTAEITDALQVTGDLPTWLDNVPVFDEEGR